MWLNNTYGGSLVGYLNLRFIKKMNRSKFGDKILPD